MRHDRNPMDALIDEIRTMMPKADLSTWTDCALEGIEEHGSPEAALVALQCGGLLVWEIDGDVRYH